MGSVEAGAGGGGGWGGGGDKDESPGKVVEGGFKNGECIGQFKAFCINLF